MRDHKPIVIFKDSYGQPLEDQIKVDGRAYNLTGANVRFRMRLATVTSLKVDSSATIVTAASGKVSYTWDDSDVDTAGEYFGWWRITPTSGAPFDTDEFLIIIAQHAPGERIRTGAVARYARSKIPITWDALEDSPKYGDRFLQDQIEVVKLGLFNTTVLAEDEEDKDIRILDYAAKLVVLQVIPAGVDYWMDQRINVSATGTNETVSYPNRVEALWQIYDRLFADVNRDRDEIEALIGVNSERSAIGVPGTSDGANQGFITPLPAEHFRDYAFDNSDWQKAGTSYGRSQRGTSDVSELF